MRLLQQQQQQQRRRRQQQRRQQRCSFSGETILGFPLLVGRMFVAFAH
jgi:hypothetical protein